MEDPQNQADRAEEDAPQEGAEDASLRATRDYHPPTLLVPPPSSALPEEPRALRSVWIEPEVTVVTSKSRLSDYAPAVARARRAHAARSQERGVGESDAPWSTNSRSESPPAGTTRGARLAALAGIVLAAVAILVSLLPKKGNIVVSATGPGNAPIASANVLVDGRLVCANVPCRVESLRRGSHLVRIQAPGYEQTADQAVAVQTNEDALIHVNLAAQNNAGIDVRVAATGLRVLIDGSDRGPAPLVVRGLPPGPHRLRIEGNSAYAPFERKLELESGQTLLVEPQLVAEKAVIHLSGGPTALGARVEVLGAGVQRDIRELPATVEVSPSASYRVRAIRAGYRDYESEVSFADGSREKSLLIDLAWDAGGKSDSATLNALAPAAPGGEGVLGANSIPISNVLIDGRPVGKTPVQLPVASGTHSVVFVHPSLGRKSVRIGVSPGKTAVAAVRF
ncbi:MAG TPA: PEGA domain-containing protein [Polyangiaceae bacterium]|nr:PEGA domain-containing protein [Polyangiaceae bacterium]